jgi:hypothetical protein
VNMSHGIRPKGRHLGLENQFGHCLYPLNATRDTWLNHEVSEASTFHAYRFNRATLLLQSEWN